MSAYFEIAYAAASGRLCLFTGTGFSKAVTQGAAPNWQEPLERCCDTLANGADLKAALFPVKGNNPLALEEAAQVISIELSKCGKSIYEEICSHINGISLSGDNSAIQDVPRAVQR